MGNIKLLDCTLRDGGHINDWRFGDNAISDIVRKLKDARLDYIELGFLRDEEKIQGRTIFQSVSDAEKFITGEKNSQKYCVMCEAMNPLPVEKIERYHQGNVEVIRVIVWKRLLEEGFEYCKEVVDKGYRLCVQPNRIDQYTYEEFRDLVQRFNQLSPLAIYVVDSFGILNSREIMKYARIADEELANDIALGYHGHNNLQQAFSTAQDLVHEEFVHDLIIDSSVYGIGRGAGNLNTELITNYMNEFCNKDYNIQAIMQINDNYIQEIFRKEMWGYLPCYYLTARHKCNPMYGYYYGIKQKLDSSTIENILAHILGEDKVRFSVEKAIKYAHTQGVIISEP